MKCEKLIILSDNHGVTKTVNNILDKCVSKNCLVIHTGDILNYDNKFLSRIDFLVSGNNDYHNLKTEQILNINDYKIFICHGHLYFDFGGYKPNYDKLVNFMNNNSIDIFIHGHLHIPYIKIYKNKLFICPGSTDYPRNISGPSFAQIYFYKDTNNNKKSLVACIYNSKTYKIIDTKTFIQ